ncbi:hypothetical protein Dimus_023489 [Dionaea muscipula]
MSPVSIQRLFFSSGDQKRKLPKTHSKNLKQSCLLYEHNIKRTNFRKDAPPKDRLTGNECPVSRMALSTQKQRRPFRPVDRMLLLAACCCCIIRSKFQALNFCHTSTNLHHGIDSHTQSHKETPTKQETKPNDSTKEQQKH